MQAVGPATQQLCVQLHSDLREKTTCIKSGGKKTQDPDQNKGSGEHWLRPVMRAIASESLAIRALPLPDSIVLAGKLGVFPAIPRASQFCAVSFRAFQRLPAVAVATPAAQKIDNRSIANLLSNLPRSICCSKLAHRSRRVSPFVSTA
jgi:hypothetical protein